MGVTATVGGTINTWGDTLVVKQCGECGIMFAMPERFDAECQKRGPSQSFYCPNGHCRVYRETEAERLKKQVVALNARIDQKDAAIRTEREQRYATERSLQATKGVVTRIKRRAAKGVCPCCNRTFSQLERHMATKHPEFAAENK